MEQAVTALTRSELNEDEVALVVEKVLDEGDLDDDGKLSFLEFEAVISKAPDFLGYAHFILTRKLLLVREYNYMQY